MDKYTTLDKQIKDPSGEANKTILSDDAYAITEAVHLLILNMRKLAR